MTGYDFHPEALVDLDEIWEFIVPDSIDAADRVVSDVLEAVAGLVSFPHRGFKRPDLTSRPLRFILVR
jgi:plasmid stabilization system protein ParE